MSCFLADSLQFLEQSPQTFLAISGHFEHFIFFYPNFIPPPGVGLRYPFLYLTLLLSLTDSLRELDSTC